jgi:putative PIN family toxin of toxin-antitoxin system
VRVFLDTNVLVSAFATRGLCADVLRYILAEHRLVVGEVVIEELRRALHEKLNLPPGQVEAIEELLRDQEVVAKPQAPAAAPERNPDDRWVIASALAAEVDLLVTGDKDLLDLGGEAPLPILDPRGFWNLVRGPGAAVPGP